jgi:hypothetical protein
MVAERDSGEPVMTFTEAAGWLERRFGRRPNAATIWRWAIKGLRGVRLQTIALGRYRYTTERAIERFIDQTSAVSGPHGATPRPAAENASLLRTASGRPRLAGGRRRRKRQSSSYDRTWACPEPSSMGTPEAHRTTDCLVQRRRCGQSPQSQRASSEGEEDFLGVGQSGSWIV